MKVYTNEELNAFAPDFLRNLAWSQFRIAGVSGMDKDALVTAIEGAQTAAAAHAQNVSSQASPVGAVPNANASSKVRVSCGASSNDFDVDGKTVAECSDVLKDILNIDRMAQAVVNGRSVSSDHVVKAGDNLEFLKPAGRKGE